MIDAFMAGGADPERIGTELARFARTAPMSVSVEDRRAVVEARLVTREWPTTLRVTAIDAETGRLHAFDSQSGVALIDAVTASGAVPGIWPVQQIHGRGWIDGGMVSAANALLAAGSGRIVVIAPLPRGLAPIPGAVDDIEVLNQASTAVLVAPDERSLAAIGPNIYDAARRGPGASTGRRQGLDLADTVAATWGTGA